MALTDTDLVALADAGVRGERIDRAAAHAVLSSTDERLLAVLAAAGRIRRHFFGNRVKLNYLVNLKSGKCPEDCGYCSQRLGAESGVLTYSWLSPEQAAGAADAGIAGGAKRVCLVASGRGPTDADIGRVATTVDAIRGRHGDVEVCACLGLLRDGQAERLRAAGVHAYNHNLNTSADNYADICSTHTYDDRRDTVRRAVAGGLSPCSGLIAGLGETDDDLVDVLYSLAELSPDSVPVNFLIPFDGTPMAGRWRLDPRRCLRILATARFVFPDVEVRVAAGRELHLRSAQPLALQVANSLFLGDYLTSEGQAGRADLDMIADAGMVVESADEPTMPADRADAGLDVAAPAETPRPDLVRVRRRGAGTELAPNA